VAANKCIACLKEASNPSELSSHLSSGHPNSVTISPNAVWSDERFLLVFINSRERWKFRVRINKARLSVYSVSVSVRVRVRVRVRDVKRQLSPRWHANVAKPICHALISFDSCLEPSRKCQSASYQPPPRTNRLKGDRRGRLRQELVGWESRQAQVSIKRPHHCEQMPIPLYRSSEK
jgi:hypothetical protein